MNSGSRSHGARRGIFIGALISIAALCATACGSAKGPSTDGGMTDGPGGETDGAAGTTASGTGGGAGTGMAGAAAGGTTGGGGAGGSGGGGSAGTSGTAAISFTNQTYQGDPRVRANEGIWSYLTGVDDPNTQTFQLHNGGASAVSIATLSITGANASFFQLAGAPQLPVTIAASADLSFDVKFLASQGAPPGGNAGGQAVNAVLGAAGTGVSASAGLFGVVLAGVRTEPTLGQVLATLGYQINVGTPLQTTVSTNDMTTTRAGDELIASGRYSKAGAGPVGLLPVGRFSPTGSYPFGYYTAPAPGCANATNCMAVATMSNASDTNTSDHSEMLLPLLASGGATTFDPGAASFGLWAYTGQATAGTPANGDYLYTEDALNATGSPQHRVRTWALKDRAGQPVANSYLLGCEEATNGDYQDYVFVLSNVQPSS